MKEAEELLEKNISNFEKLGIEVEVKRFNANPRPLKDWKVVRDPKTGITSVVKCKTNKISYLIALIVYKWNNFINLLKGDSKK